MSGPGDSAEFDYEPKRDANEDSAPPKRPSQVSAGQSDKDEAAAIVAQALADKDKRDADAKRVQSGDMSKDDLQALINAKLAASKKR